MLAAPAIAEEAAPIFQQDVVILFTSDVHCGVESNFGYAGLALVRDAYERAGNHVLLVDNGDSIQGEPVGTMTSGEANVKLMNAVGYDIATMGNHEFDYGMDRFFELTKMANFPYISCNFNKHGELQFAPYVIKEFDGVKIAFVGISTPKTLTSSTPKYFQDENGNFIYGFFEDETGEKLYAAVQKAVDDARAEGAQFVIAMAHLGNESECKPYTYADVIANTSGINAMLDGHSHDTAHVKMRNKDGKTVLRQGCGTKLQGIGYLKIASGNGAMDTGVMLWNCEDFNATEMYNLDTDVTEAVSEATDELNAALELSVSSMPGEYGGFLQVSGLTFEVDMSIPSGVKRDEKNMFVGVEGSAASRMCSSAANRSIPKRPTPSPRTTICCTTAATAIPSSRTAPSRRRASCWTTRCCSPTSLRD